jgi:hypothetical protein
MNPEVQEGALPQGAEIVDKPLTQAEINKRQREEAATRKAAATELADYKKRLRASNDLKREQCEEIELNIRFYHAKKQWLEMQDKIEELEAKEQALIAEEKKKQKEFMEELKKKAEAKEKEEKAPDIIVPKTGKPRDK